MNLLVLYERVKNTLSEIDRIIELGVSEGIDCTMLEVGKRSLLGFLSELVESLEYKAERAEYYGEDLDDVGKEDLYNLIEEVGYEHVASLFDVKGLLREGGI